MTSIRQIIAVLLVFSLAPARPAVLGIVTHADGASIGETDASEGTTVYDGDCLSTEENGTIGLRLQTVTAQLGSQSKVTFRLSENEQRPEAELASGTLVFSTRTAAGINVRADGALIHPAEEALTIGYIRVINPQELQIFARRGSMTVSYGDQSAAITEGSAYRILLDPSTTDEPAADGGKDKSSKKTGHQTAFRMILIGAAAAGAVWAIVNAMSSSTQPQRNPESPYKP